MPHSSPLEEDIFLEALGLPPPERGPFVGGKCPGDRSLADRVMGLLRGYEENSAYLETPPISGVRAILNSPGMVQPRDHVVGDRIGNCRLLEKIGEGGCGLVYRAEQLEPVQRPVALKVIKVGLDTHEFVVRFEAERQALALMDHANIARVFDAGTTPAGRPYFTMELVRGLPLTNFADEQQLSLSQRLELFVTVCHALQHAHQKGIIHRDLKPSNVLVALHDGQPVPKVIDFGIAKALHAPLAERRMFTRHYAFVGTPAYTSPEQIEPGELDVDTRSDIYSLGVLLYELLTGHLPFDRTIFERAGLDETRRIIRECEPPRPSARVDALTDEQRSALAGRCQVAPGKLASLLRVDLDWIVMCCLEKDRTRRYATANALATDIRRYMAGEPVSARPPSRAYLVRKFVRRHQTGVLVAGVVLVSLVAGLVAAGILLAREKVAHGRAVAAEHAETALRRQAEQARQNEARRASRAIIDLANERLTQGRTAEGLAYLASAARRDPTNPTLAPRLASVLTSRNFLLSDGELARHSAPVVALEFSTDGSRLTAVWEGGTLGRVNLTDGVVEKETFSSTSLYGYSRMTTRRFLLVYTADGIIRPIDRETGKIAHEIRYDFDALGCRAIDAECDLFTTKLTNNVIIVCDASTGRMIGAPIPYDAYLGAGQKWMAWSADGTRAPTKRVHFRRTDDPEVEMTVEFPIEIAHADLATSPDGRRLATVQREGESYFLRLWSLPEGLSTAQPQPLDRSANAFFSPDGKFVVCWGHGLEVFEAATGARVSRMPSAGLFVDDSRYAFSPDGKTIATWGNADTVDLWDLATGVPRVAPLRHGGNVGDVSFSRDGKIILTKSDGLARVWHTGTGELLAEPTVQVRGVPAVALSPDGTELVVGTASGAIHRFRLGAGAGKPLVLARTAGLPATFLPGTPTRLLWLTENRARVLDLASGQDIGPGLAYPEPIRSAKFRPDRSVAVVQTPAGEWRAWWWENGAIKVIPLHDASSEIASVAFSAAAQNLAVISWPGSMRAWNLATGLPAGPAIATTANAAFARFASFSADGQRVLVGSIQGKARVWDVATGEERVDFGQQPTNILFATYSPDGTWIATGNRRGATRLWEAATGKPLGPQLPHPGMWGEAVFSPDSRLVATFGAGEMLQLQEVKTGGTMVGAIETAGALRSVRFNADSTRLVTATEEGKTQVWDVATGLPVTETMRHGGGRNPLAEFSPDGRFLRTESGPNGKFCFWSVPPALPVGATTPAWLIELATICAGKVVNDAGQLEDASDSADAIQKLREEVAALPDDSPYVECGRWFFAKPGQRSIAPEFSVTPQGVAEIERRR